MEASLEPFLNRQFGSAKIQVLPLAGDASTRRYYRVVTGDQTWVLMSWDPFETKSFPFLSVCEHFSKNGVQVPKIMAMGPTEGLVLMEDLGDLTLERKFWENQQPEACLPFYRAAIDELIKIHFVASKDRRPCTAFDIEFDVAKLLWEMNYGKQHLLQGIYKCQISSAADAALTKVFTHICERLHSQPKYIAHRDYHSRNVMLLLDRVRVIDFQDARMGPVQYDLVSLLRDSYVAIPDSMQQTLLDDYLTKAAPYFRPGSRDEFMELFEIQTIQRCFKACGSFASFFMLRQDRRYLKYIAPTLQTVLRSLERFPEYSAMSEAILAAAETGFD